jgi:lysophospholipase
MQCGVMTEFFHDIAGNPRPDNARYGTMTTRDGITLRHACFAATARPLRGTVVILPGRNECIEKYFETIRDLSARGLGSAIMDWRGQGRSDRLIRDPMRGHVRSFDDYVADLDQFFAEIVLPDCRGPYYVLGHSTGSLIGLLASPVLVNRVRRMVLVAPFLSVTNMPFSMRGVLRLATILYYLGFGGSYAYGGKRPRESTPFVTNTLTSDLDRYTRNVRLYETYPELALGGPTVSWIRAACKASFKVQDPDFMAAIQLPVLFIGAGADTVVSTKAVEAYALRLKTGSLLTIDGARHEILQEADRYREQLFAAFDAFVPGTEQVAA